MSLLVWGPNLRVGITLIDQQHERLVALINALNDTMGAGKSRSVLAGILDELISYTNTHFASEEDLMRQHAYGDAPSHKSEHSQLLAKVADFKQQFDSGNTKIAGSLLTFLCDWLSEHILGTDMRFGRTLLEKGVK